MIYSYNDALQASVEYFQGDELAAKVFVDKYALRDNDNNILEKTPDDEHAREAGEFARIEAKKFKNPLSYDEILSYLKGYKYIVVQGSPAFGIGNDYVVTSLSNCYVASSPGDSYGHIMQTDQELVQISKRRGGVGIDLSKLRPHGAPTKNAARTSTGIPSWMQRYSNSINEVGQSGRRGALMLTLDIHHPDSVYIDEKQWENPQPIVIKGNPDNFERDIVTDSRFYNESRLDFCSIKLNRRKVTGANVSLRLSNEFLNAVRNGEKYEQRFPVDYKERGIKPLVSRMVDARKVWQKIIHCSWQSAEPGLMFWDRVVRYNPVDTYKEFGFETVCCNPCCFSLSHTHNVVTKNGNKLLPDINDSDIIISPTDNGLIEAKSSGFFPMGEAEVFRVRFDNNAELVITANHNLCVVSPTGQIVLMPLSMLPVGFRDVYTADNKTTSIVSIESLGVREVGCVNVPGYHTMVVNGIYTGQSELPLCEHDSCRLMFMNLYSYVDNAFLGSAKFNFDKFYKHTIIAQRLMDDMIDLEIEKIDKIIAKIQADPEVDQIKAEELHLWQKIKEKCLNGRRTGLGISGLGDTLAALNIAYGSPQSIEMTSRILMSLKHAAYESSVEMSKELGPFPIWNWDLDSKSEFLQQLGKERPDIYDGIKQYGRRNIANLTIAPVGSRSMMTKTTSGIEPCYQLAYTRRKKINHSDESVKPDFVDANGDRWQNFTIFHPKVLDWMRVTGETDVTKSPWYNACANDIDWVNRVRLQAAAQRHIDHAISSTINLPESVPEAEIAKIFETAWESGCKGITVYRDKCRSGVLVTNNKEEKVQTNASAKRPKSLPCDIHHIKVTKKLDKVRTFDYIVAVGLMNGKPYEVFAFENGVMDSKIKNGVITKVKRGQYRLELEDGNAIDNITNTTSEEEDVVTRLVSMLLRHGIDIGFVLQQLNKSEGDLWSYNKAIWKALKKYVKDDTKVVGAVCKKCGGSNLRYENGCATCVDCGDSKCG